MIVGFIPFPRDIAINETAMEYSLTDEERAVPHEVHIEGTYYTRLFGKDRFSGGFYISDIEKLDKETRVDFQFHPNARYYPQSFVTKPFIRVTEIGAMFFNRNFETLAFQLAYQYRDDENGSHSSSRDDLSNFIVVGVEDRTEALNTYQKLLEEMK